MKNCQSIDQIVLSQYNGVEILFESLIRKKFQMECFWNVFETITKVPKENGFHGNLVTKQN